VTRWRKELSEIGSCTSLPADLSTEVGSVSVSQRDFWRAKTISTSCDNAGARGGAPWMTNERSLGGVLSLNVKGVFHLTKFLRPCSTRTAPQRVRHD